MPDIFNPGGGRPITDTGTGISSTGNLSESFTGFHASVMADVREECQLALNSTISKLHGKMEEVSTAISEVWYAPEAVQYNEDFNQQCKDTTNLIIAIFQNYLNGIAASVNYWYVNTKEYSEEEKASGERFEDLDNCPKMSWNPDHTALPDDSVELSADDIKNIHLNPLGGYCHRYIESPLTATDLVAGDQVKADLDGKVLIDTERARTYIRTRLTEIYDQIVSDLSTVSNSLASSIDTLLIGQSQSEVVNAFFNEIILQIKEIFKFIVGEEGSEENPGIIHLMETCAKKYEDVAQNVKASYQQESDSESGSGTTTTPDPGVGPSAGSV